MLLSTSISQKLLQAITGNNASATASTGTGEGISVQIGSYHSCYIGLSTTEPTTTGTGFTEPSADNGYKRYECHELMSLSYQSYQKNETKKTTHTRRIGNTDEISFHEAALNTNPDATEGADWGKIRAYLLFNSETSTTPYAWGVLNNYTLLTEKPEDWDTEYATYYTKLGARYYHVEGTQAPTWEENKYYSNYVEIKTHTKFIFRSGHFELYLDGDELKINADGDNEV
jgi:hypothetical protein